MESTIFKAFSGELEKLAWDWGGFREGLADEGIPLGGATLGAAIGAKKGLGLRGAALGYAAGGGLSLLRSKLKGEKPSMARKMLAAGALGYGAGGMAHAGLSRLTQAGKAGAKAVKAGPLAKYPKLHGAFHNERSFAHGLTEEGLPAIGATLGTASAMATEKKKKTHAPGTDLVKQSAIAWRLLKAAAPLPALQQGIATLGTGRAMRIAHNLQPAAAAAPVKRTFDMGALRAAQAAQGPYRGLGKNPTVKV